MSIKLGFMTKIHHKNGKLVTLRNETNFPILHHLNIS